MFYEIKNMSYDAANAPYNIIVKKSSLENVRVNCKKLLTIFSRRNGHQHDSTLAIQITLFNPVSYSSLFEGRKNIDFYFSLPN